MDVFANLITLYAVKKDYNSAIQRCEEQVKKVGNAPAIHAVIHNLKGKLLLAKKENSSAEDAFKIAIKENPDFIQPYYSLAKLYLAEKKEDKAIEQLEAILSKNSEQTAPHMLLGIIFDTQKKFDISEKHYRAALKINPEFAPAANNLAYLLADQQKDINEALNFAQKAKEKLPKDPGVMDTLGWIYYKKGLYDSAISEFTDSLKQLPENATIHYHLGLAYKKKGKKDLAIKELEKALSLDAGFSGAEQARKILSGL